MTQHGKYYGAGLTLWELDGVEVMASMGRRPNVEHWWRGFVRHLSLCGTLRAMHVQAILSDCA